MATLLSRKSRRATDSNSSFYSVAVPKSCSPDRATGLFVIADAAAHIPRFGHETHFLNGGFVLAGSWKQVINLSDLTFRFLRRGIQVRAIYLARAVFKRPNICVQELLCIVACDRKDFAIAEIKAEWIKVAV